jgi:hypothetical protein
MNLEAARLGNIASISKEDIEVFDARGGDGGKSVEPVWRYYTAWLEKAGN